MIFSRTLLGAALVTAGSLPVIAAAVAGASPATAGGPDPRASAPIGMTFVPPKVGPITVGIGPTIIGGKVIDPGLKVTVPEVTVPRRGAAEEPPVEVGHASHARG